MDRSETCPHGNPAAYAARLAGALYFFATSHRSARRLASSAARVVG
jgi:hypothetical protein